MDECPETSHFGLKKTGDCGQSIEDRTGNAPDKSSNAFLAAWHRQRGPVQRKGERASRLGQITPRLSTATLKHLNCRARFSVVSGLFCSSQNLACRPTQKNGKVVSLFRIKVPACLDRRRTAAVGCVRAGNGHLPLQVAVGPESLGTAPSWFSNPQGYSGNAEASKDRNVHHVQNRAESNRSGKLTGDDRHRQWRHFNSEVCKRCIENHQG